MSFAAGCSDNPSGTPDAATPTPNGTTPPLDAGADTVSPDVADTTAPPDGDPPCPDGACSHPDASDARHQPDDVDQSCPCTALDSGLARGVQPLDCYCARSSCPSYAAALEMCPTNSPMFNRVESYASCNLVVVTAGGGFGGTNSC